MFPPIALPAPFRGDLLRDLGLCALRLIAVGLIAIGLSGAIALLMGETAGKKFVAGDAPGVTYTAERCADYLSYYPNESDCAEAALYNHFDETVFYRAPMGVLGIGALGLYIFLRRRVHDEVRPLALLIEATAAGGIFGAAALLLLAQGAQTVVFGGASGTGMWLSAGIMAALAFLYYAVRFLRAIERIELQR